MQSEDIVNESCVSDTNDSPVSIDLQNLDAGDGIKKIVREEFKYILELLDFDKKAHEIFRNWYIDGRLYYNKVIDQKRIQAGVKNLEYIDIKRWLCPSGQRRLQNRYRSTLKTREEMTHLI